MSDMKTIIIDAELHSKLKKYCKENKLKINEYVNGLIEDHLQGSVFAFC